MNMAIRFLFTAVIACAVAHTLVAGIEDGYVPNPGCSCVPPVPFLVHIGFACFFFHVDALTMLSCRALFCLLVDKNEVTCPKKR